MEADTKQHPNCKAGARHGERLMALQRDAEQRPEKRTRKRIDQADAGRDKTARKDGTTCTQLVKAPLKLRELAQTKRTSVARAQQRETERMWEKD